MSDWRLEIKQRQSGRIQRRHYSSKEDKWWSGNDCKHPVLLAAPVRLDVRRVTIVSRHFLYAELASTGALGLEGQTKAWCKYSQQPRSSSTRLHLPFLPTISISNSPCFASELHACVHAITAFQVVACPTGRENRLCVLCVCVRARLCLCVQVGGRGEGGFRVPLRGTE